MGFFNWTAPLVKRFGERWTPEMVSMIAGWLRPFIPGGGHLLDLGGGAGGLAQRLTRALSCRVTVLDPTPELLSAVQLNDRVSAVLGSAEKMPFEDDEFDALIVADAFHHFRHLDESVREMARVVRPDGAILILELDRSATSVKIVGAVERLFGEPAAFFTPRDLCAYMKERGIDGECEHVSRSAYRFLGTVKKPWPAA